MTGSSRRVDVRADPVECDSLGFVADKHQRRAARIKRHIPNDTFSSIAIAARIVNMSSAAALVCIADFLAYSQRRAAFAQ